MRKSILSKISGYSSILNTASPDQNLQILRISLKKQIDRKQKLQKLMEKYQQITIQEKSHIKSIKSNIIELKDLQSNSKTKFYLNPIIYVDNNLSKQTRQYLCILLNTFYSKYDQNSESQFKTKQLTKSMNSLLQDISLNEQNLLKIEKQTITTQVQLQGQLLTYKTKLKDQSQRQKQLQDQFKRINTICQSYEQKYKQQLNKVQRLRQNSKQIQDKIYKLKDKVAEGQLIKKGKQEMMANQIAYQEKFKLQLNNCDDDIEKQKQLQKSIKIKIKHKKQKVQQLRSNLNQLSNSIISLSQINNSQIPNNHHTSQKLFVQSCKLNNQQYPNNNQNHLSLSKIKKYSEFANSINHSLQTSKSVLSPEFTKSIDKINHQVNIKIIQMKNENNLNCPNKKSRMSVR